MEFLWIGLAVAIIVIAAALIISLHRYYAPCERQILRNARSLTPASGARQSPCGISIECIFMRILKLCNILIVPFLPFAVNFFTRYLGLCRQSSLW